MIRWWRNRQLIHAPGWVATAPEGLYAQWDLAEREDKRSGTDRHPPIPYGGTLWLDFTSNLVVSVAFLDQAVKEAGIVKARVVCVGLYGQDPRWDWVSDAGKRRQVRVERKW